MAITGHTMTLAEFLALPEEKPALEYVAGAVRQKVAPEAQHSLEQLILCRWIDDFALARRVAVALPEWRTIFAGAVHVPDVAVCLWGRIPRDARGRPSGPLREPPLIAIEIASPDQSRRQLRDDCAWYVANGVALALLVDPESETILAYRPNAAPEPLQGAAVVDFGDALPGFQFVVRDLFAAARLD
ncbi:MAG TPA: Uma2 family endonuclease [Chloroflexota bacterium]|nr:Uma2 family endonuclease [Chloroflexota bacterium]